LDILSSVSLSRFWVCRIHLLLEWINFKLIEKLTS
jgi:hypothetical protein